MNSVSPLLFGRWRLPLVCPPWATDSSDLLIPVLMWKTLIDLLTMAFPHPGIQELVLSLNPSSIFAHFASYLLGLDSGISESGQPVKEFMPAC